MTTTQTIITDAYFEARVIGELDSPSGNQSVRALRWLNRMISLLSAEEVMIPYSTSENFSIGTSSASYTMGSGGTASSSRARKITNCFIRDSAGQDFPVDIITEQKYNAIFDKDMPGRPIKLFYDPVYPTGVIYFYFQPDQDYTAYIESQKDLHSTLTLATSISLPGEYEEFLVSSLAAKIASVYGSTNLRELVMAALNAKYNILGLNLSQRVPEAVLPFSKHTGIGHIRTNSDGSYMELAGGGSLLLAEG